MSDTPGPPKKSALPFLLVAVIVVACVVALVRGVTGKASRFVDARPAPIKAQWSQGAWYWIENAQQAGSRLVRADGGGRKEIAAAEEIVDFSVGGDHVAWAARDSGAWSISIAGREGGATRVARQSPMRLSGVWCGSDRIYWLEQTPAVIPDAGPLPPLEGGVKIVSVPTAGGPVTEHATLMEPEGLAVIGKRGEDLFVSTFRPGAYGTTAFFRVPLGGGVSQRVAGTVSRQSGLLTSDGALYWLGPSREASRPQASSSVYRLTENGQIEALTDWLPGGGRLFETTKGVIYVDGLLTANAWPIRGGRELPRPLRSPADHAVMAVGGSEMILRPFTEGTPQSVPLYRMGLP